MAEVDGRRAQTRRPAEASARLSRSHPGVGGVSREVRLCRDAARPDSRSELKQGDAPVVVVGACPCGLAAGIALKQAGIEAVLIDKGCIVQSIANYPTNLTFFSTPERLEIGGIKFESNA